MNATLDTQTLICGEDVTPPDNNEERRQALQDEINNLRSQIKDKHSEIEETKTQINITQ
jgi:transcription initiation factor IIE alpha subunit